MSLEDEIRTKAAELRIHMLGFSPVEKTEYGRIVKERLARGLIPSSVIKSTECFRIPDTYGNPAESLPGAKTIVCVGGSYLEDNFVPGDVAVRGAIARHYWRDSYTDLARKRDELLEFIKSRGFKAERAKMHPREAARLTGLAWIGRNALAINPAYGSWAEYWAIVTDAEIEPTPRLDKSCPKNCRRCMDACPTKALIEPYVLDVNRCLNYILEETGPMSEWARQAVGRRLNGCDTCQEACPMNKKAKLAPLPLTAPKPDQELVPYPMLERCLDVTQQEMDKNYAYMDWNEPTVRYLVRNALVAIGNSGEKDLARLARRHAESADSLLREQARWALEKLA